MKYADDGENDDDAADYKIKKILDADTPVFSAFSEISHKWIDIFETSKTTARKQAPRTSLRAKWNAKKTYDGMRTGSQKGGRKRGGGQLEGK